MEQINSTRNRLYPTRQSFCAEPSLVTTPRLRRSLLATIAPLYQTALRVLGNPEDAEDALQEGMLSAYRNLPRFEGRSQFSTWLTRIVINAALMRRRSRRAHAAVSLDEPSGEDQTPAVERFRDEGPSPEQLYAGYELSERLRTNLEGLSPVLRRAFELRELAGLTADETAKVLGVSRNTLKARLWRAKHQLATRLNGMLDGRSLVSHRTRSLSAAAAD